ncbi:hypothetical protein PHYBOEH_000419 [Phytophthora boehmeriae]|uniref:Mucin-like protein n=1 Tax=Phytophthora boehmeriae TaxID=109152 RepID=A0A8T1X1P9_9STRA|nr:hypothetical protein PHYBOEH_000419 [Phytophthora boehmeriae]
MNAAAVDDHFIDALMRELDEVYSSESGSASDSLGFDSGSDEAASAESGSIDNESRSYSGYSDCTEISVEDDATYCIEGAICSGEAELPTGYACPVKYDVAISDCADGLPSFMGGECIAPVDSVCQQVKSGAWGCVWEDAQAPTSASTAPTSTNESIEIPVYSSASDSYEGEIPSVTPAATGTTEGTPTATTEASGSDCTEVSVNGDATYCISGNICSGDGDAPAGDRCPVSGDAAVADCLDGLPSFKDGQCVAPIDAVCQKIETGAWGCVWPEGSGGSAESGAAEGSAGSVESYSVGTSDAAAATAGTTSQAATVVAAVAGVLLVAVIAVGAIMWSRKKRNQRAQNPAHDGEIMEDVLTPPNSARASSFHRV